MSRKRKQLLLRIFWRMSWWRLSKSTVSYQKRSSVLYGVTANETRGICMYDHRWRSFYLCISPYTHESNFELMFCPVKCGLWQHEKRDVHEKPAQVGIRILSFAHVAWHLVGATLFRIFWKNKNRRLERWYLMKLSKSLMSPSSFKSHPAVSERKNERRHPSPDYM